MGLSIICWLITFVVGAFAGFLIMGRIKYSDPRKVQILYNALGLFVLLLFVCSPLYLEFPGTKDYTVAVLDQKGQIEFKNLGIFEPLAKGKIVRLPIPGQRIEHLLKEQYINSFPLIKTGQVKIFFKITNYDKYISHTNWLSQRNCYSRILENYLDLLAIDQLKQELINFFSSKKIKFIHVSPFEKEYKDKARPIEERLKKFLQTELDKIDSGLEITSVSYCG